MTSQHDNNAAASAAAAGCVTHRPSNHVSQETRGAEKMAVNAGCDDDVEMADHR